MIYFFVYKKAILEPNDHANLAIVTMNQMLQNVSFYIFRWFLPIKTLFTIKKDELKYWELVWSLRIIIPKYLYLQFSENAVHYKNIRIFDSIMAPFWANILLYTYLVLILMQIRKYYHSRMKNDFIFLKLDLSIILRAFGCRTAPKLWKLVCNMYFFNRYYGLKTNEQ